MKLSFRASDCQGFSVRTSLCPSSCSCHTFLAKRHSGRSSSRSAITFSGFLFNLWNWLHGPHLGLKVTRSGSYFLMQASTSSCTFFSCKSCPSCRSIGGRACHPSLSPTTWVNLQHPAKISKATHRVSACLMATKEAKVSFMVRRLSLKRCCKPLWGLSIFSISAPHPVPSTSASSLQSGPIVLQPPCQSSSWSSEGCVSNAACHGLPSPLPASHEVATLSFSTAAPTDDSPRFSWCWSPGRCSMHCPKTDNPPDCRSRQLSPAFWPLTWPTSLVSCQSSPSPPQSSPPPPPGKARQESLDLGWGEQSSDLKLLLEVISSELPIVALPETSKLPYSPPCSGVPACEPQCEDPPLASGAPPIAPSWPHSLSQSLLLPRTDRGNPECDGQSDGKDGIEEDWSAASPWGGTVDWWLGWALNASWALGPPHAKMKPTSSFKSIWRFKGSCSVTTWWNSSIFIM